VYIPILPMATLCNNNHREYSLVLLELTTLTFPWPHMTSLSLGGDYKSFMSIVLVIVVSNKRSYRCWEILMADYPARPLG
jgi:hypothetical protein